MIQEEPLPLKAICVWCFIIASGLITAYIGLISLVSVWVGFTHIGRFGFWVPILAGTILFVTVFCLYFRAVKAIRRRLDREEVFDI
jgi:hypothetical protein